MPDQILNFINAYGYAFVFLGTFFEGELVLIAAAFLSHTGLLNFWWVALVGFLGAIAGDNFWFYIGELGGPRLIKRFGRFLRITDERVAAAKTVMHAHGHKAVFAARFVFGTRLSTAIVAGALGMPKLKFFKANVSGAAVWVFAVVTLGYLFGRSYKYLEKLVKRTEIALLILVLLAIIILIFRIRRSRALSAKNKES